MEINKFCLKCGAQLNDGQVFCGNCGARSDNSELASSDNDNTFPQMQPRTSDGSGSAFIKCPQCGGRHLAASTEAATTVTSGGGYNGAAGCLGMLMFGPCGLLCGNCGSSASTAQTKNKTFWICRDCGYKFRNLNDLRDEIDNNKKYSKIITILLAAFAFSLAVLTSAISDTNFLLCLILLGLVSVLPVFVGYRIIIKKGEKEYAELEEKTRVKK